MKKQMLMVHAPERYNPLMTVLALHVCLKLVGLDQLQQGRLMLMVCQCQLWHWTWRCRLLRLQRILCQLKGTSLLQREWAAVLHQEVPVQLQAELCQLTDLF